MSTCPFCHSEKPVSAPYCHECNRRTSLGMHFIYALFYIPTVVLGFVGLWWFIYGLIMHVGN